MFTCLGRLGSGVRTTLLFTAVLLGALTATGCATPYVDGALKDVAVTEYQHPKSPQPAQMLFSFQTKGTANARATEFLKSEVLKTTLASGLFSTVTTDPVANGALLSVTINNVPVTDNAFAKGFATGLTFGLAGNTVTDGYVCTLDYISAPATAKISRSTRHAIHTTVGAKGAPPNSVKAKNLDEAVKTMTRQIVGNALKDLATDPAFAL